MQDDCVLYVWNMCPRRRCSAGVISRCGVSSACLASTCLSTSSCHRILSFDSRLCLYLCARSSVPTYRPLDVGTRRTRPSWNGRSRGVVDVYISVTVQLCSLPIAYYPICLLPSCATSDAHHATKHILRGYFEF